MPGRTSERRLMSKRVVVWGTGFVGKLVIPEIVKHRFTDGSGRDAATAGCLATGMRALNAVPAVTRLGHRT